MPRTGQSRKGPLNPQVGARVEDELLVEIKVLATRQHRRFNDLVKEALQDLLRKYREKRKEPR